jgi:hypothetical protein
MEHSRGHSRQLTLIIVRLFAIRPLLPLFTLYQLRRSVSQLDCSLEHLTPVTVIGTCEQGQCASEQSQVVMTSATYTLHLL